ncbi:MAG TPA: hypothetical protein VFI92_00235 [Steroidobacteraceae bacterium]|nr:hypothetical protein [Steroidobacteraceae bacterium]
MNARRLARGLGWFSIGVGLAELIAPGRITRPLGLHGDQARVQAFGLRELLSGAAILMSRGRAPHWVWARVAGDLMDMGLLQSATPVDGKRRTNLNVAKAAVLGAAALDMFTAQKLSQQQAARRRRVLRGTALQQRRFI